MMAKLYLLLFIAALGAGAYWKYNNMLDTIETLETSNTLLEVEVATTEQALEMLQDDYESIQIENTRINEAYAEIRRQNARLAERLSDSDLGLLAAERPDSIERLVNRGTINAGRCFEILSGSPLTEEELNAENAESFNRECPWLFDTYVDPFRVQPNRNSR
jgi:hypothetical protein